MASPLFSLKGEILVDNDKANKSINKTGENADTLGSKLKKGLGTAAKWAAGLAAGAVAVGTAVYKATEKVAQEMDVIDKGSARMGVSTESYQELAYAAGQCGVEMTTMEKAAKKLQGTDMSMDDAMKSIMALGTEEERAAKASELFGSAVAYQMMPLLQQGEQGFNDLTKRAHDLGLVFGEDTVKAGVTLGDTMSDVKQALSAVGTSVAAELMPIVQEALNWVIEHMPEIRETIHNVVEFVKKAVKTLAPVIKPILKTIGDALSWLIDLLDKIINGFKNFKMPKIKLPHFAITPKGWSIGDLLKGSIPKLGIEWYAKGGILENPTLFGLNGNNAMIGGEKGPEAVAPISDLMNYFEKALTIHDNALADKLDNMFELMKQYLPTYSNMNVVLDSGALVGEIAPNLNYQLGRIATRNGRGG